MDLHQFKWARDVGEIPSKWNHLVGEYDPRSGVKLVHYTLGAPCFRKYQNCEYAQEWFEELGRMTHCSDPDSEGSYHDDLSGRTDTNCGGLPEPHGPDASDTECHSGNDPAAPAATDVVS